MKVVFLTVHNATSSRKVDFHFWADVIGRQYDVDFVTVGFSFLTQLKQRGKSYTPPYNQWIVTFASEQYKRRKYLWRAPVHPMRTGNAYTDKLFDKIFSFYPALMPKNLLDSLATMTVCVVENGAGLLLVPYLKQLYPHVHFVYNVCDRIDTLGYHPSILRAEKQALPIFSKIRVPAEVMLSDFPDYRDKTVYIPHGLQKEQFDMPCSTPYASHKNMVSVGDMLFDATAIRCIAEMYPDWTIHLFGRGARLLAAPANVVTHGEKPFEDIIPYIRHADIGLAPYAIASNADYLSQSSMKMIQYTYSKIPIVAPNFAASGRPHVCGYVPGDKDSLYSAVQKAISYDRADIDNMNVMTWDQTVDRLLEGIIN